MAGWQRHYRRGRRSELQIGGPLFGEFGLVRRAGDSYFGQSGNRVLLRRLVGEQNRFYFEQWEWIELGVGMCLLLVLVFGNRPPKVAILLALSMLLIVLTQRIGLTPRITSLGQTLDLLPPNFDGPDKKTFWTLHGIYSGLELLKLALGAIIAFLLIIRRGLDQRTFARESALDDSHSRVAGELS